jgi:hypothetical protein
MEIITTSCPECRQELEFPRDFKNLICPGCRTAFEIRQYKGVFSLSKIEKAGPAAASREIGRADLEIVETRLAELEELIEEAGTEIEVLRSREQSGPLQLGCAFFGLFMLGLMVIIGFMLLGRGYVGHWAFYLTLAAAILLGVARARRKLSDRHQMDEFRNQRRKLEAALLDLTAERDRLLKIKEIVVSTVSHSATGDQPLNG